MSNSVRPHRRQPTRLPVPEILQARTLEWFAISFSNAYKWKVKVKSLSRAWLLATPWTAAYRLLHPWDYPGKSTGVGCHCLLQISIILILLSLSIAFCFYPFNSSLFFKHRKSQKLEHNRRDLTLACHIFVRETFQSLFPEHNAYHFIDNNS